MKSNRVEGPLLTRQGASLRRLFFPRRVAFDSSKPKARLSGLSHLKSMEPPRVSLQYHRLLPIGAASRPHHYATTHGQGHGPLRAE